MTKPEWMKAEQEWYDEELIDGPFTSYYEKPVQLKPTPMNALIKAQELLSYPIEITDNYITLEKKIEAREKYLKDFAQWEEQGFWTTGGGKRIETPPLFQAGEKSFHPQGQAFDLNPNYKNMNLEETYEALRSVGFARPRPEEEPSHWSMGEVTEKNTGGPVTQPLYDDRKYII